MSSATENKPLNLVWIGCGRHAEQMLLPQIVRQNVKILGVCDINKTAAHTLAARYGIARVETDYRALLDLPDIDVVGMAVGPTQHRDMALEALACGYHVFMEKPCGASAADAMTIRDAANRAGKKVGLGFMKRYSTANRMAYNVMRSAEFGQVAGFFGQYMTAPAYFSGGMDYSSFYLHHCIHYMDLAAWYVAPIMAVTVFRHEIWAGKLLLHVHLEYANGALGTLIMGTIQSRGTPMERLQIMGDHRRIEVDGVVEMRYLRNPPFKSDDPNATLNSAEDTLSWKPNFTAAANEDFKGYNALFSAFFAQVRGEVSDMPLIDEGVQAMRVLEAVIKGASAPGVRISV